MYKCFSQICTKEQNQMYQHDSIVVLHIKCEFLPFLKYLFNGIMGLFTCHATGMNWLGEQFF